LASWPTLVCSSCGDGTGSSAQPAKPAWQPQQLPAAPCATPPLAAHTAHLLAPARRPQVPLTLADAATQSLHTTLQLNKADVEAAAALQQQAPGRQQPGEEAPAPLHGLCATLRRQAEGDRELMERGVKAFVSYVRGYKEHHCKFIFRWGCWPWPGCG
jgi:hypothetical protein